MEERDLDFYANTPDEHFNISTQKLYIKFKGSKKPQTDKPYEVFINAISEAYFFAIYNPSKPFGCIAKVKELANLWGFNDADLLIFVDMLLSVISNKPDSEQYSMIIIQLFDFRHELSPFESAQEIRQVLNKDYYFDIDKIQETLKNTTDPHNKITYLTNLKFDYESRKFEMNDVELEYYKIKGLLHYIKSEMDRAKFEVEVLNTKKSINNDKQVIDFKLASDRRADFIRMISDMIDNDIFEPVNPAVLLTKEYVLKAFETFLNEDLSTVIVAKKPLRQAEREKPSKKSEEQGKAFPYYLLHENKIKLAEAIKEEFSTEKGKAIRIMLEAMEAYQPPLISISSRQAKELHKSLGLFMNRDIGTYQGVFGYTIKEKTDKADIDSVTVRLNHLLKMIEKDKIA